MKWNENKKNVEKSGTFFQNERTHTHSCSVIQNIYSTYGNLNVCAAVIYYDSRTGFIYALCKCVKISLCFTLLNFFKIPWNVWTMPLHSESTRQVMRYRIIIVNLVHRTHFFSIILSSILFVVRSHTSHFPFHNFFPSFGRCSLRPTKDIAVIIITLVYK